MDRLQAMKIFERVVEEGGFAAAAASASSISCRMVRTRCR